MKNIETGLITSDQFLAVVRALKKGFTDATYVSSITGLGPVKEFEEAFAEVVGGKFALAVSSCTAAIHTSLMALGIGPGDEVIVTPYTWGQSVGPVLFTGATAVFADIDPKTLTIDPKSVEKRVSNKTKAIIPVHIFGNPADMDSLCSIAKKHRLSIISDAAQAFGALSKGRKIGSVGDAACFSLGRGKTVCGGEGGVLVTNNEEFYEKAVAISQHPLRAFKDIVGFDLPYFDELGWNYRIHPIAAVIALADLKVAPKRIAIRKEFSDAIHKKLKAISFLEPVQCSNSDTSAYYGIPLTFEDKMEGGVTRDSVLELLHSMGIYVQPGPIRIPIHLRPSFQNGGEWMRINSHLSHQIGSCPVAEHRCNYQEMYVFNNFIETEDKSR